MPTTRSLAGYGWRPSLPDWRDQVADTAGLTILAEVDPRHEYMTPVYNQLRLGSCVPHTIVEQVDADRIVNGEDPYYASRLALYWETRKREGQSPRADTGAFGRDALWASQHVGLWPESLIGYTDDVKDPRFFTDPARLSHEVAPLRLERPYKAVPRELRAMKAVLSNRQTIAFGFSVYSSFESDEVARTGVVPMPTRGEENVGGHETLLVGYLKDEPDYGLVRNHWDVTWGIAGYFLMPWKYILNPSLASDFRTVYRPAS